MSDFLAVSIVPTGRKRPSRQAIEVLVPEGITLVDLAGTKFGSAVGRMAERPVFSLVHGGTSTDLLDRGHRNSARSECMHDFFANLLEQFGGFAVLVHFCRGHISTEPVEAQNTRKLPLADFLEEWPKLEDDVRYVVVAG